ncbi:MAG: cob(I)yrinic acid a,c-diamide adenosyltransferase [Planctomycetota bacterium]
MAQAEFVRETFVPDLTLYARCGYVYNAAMLEKGLVQIYTGDGKGKTTAAFGLALRAAGQGNRVLIYQFLKPPTLDTGERLVLKLKAVGINLEAVDVPWEMPGSFEDETAVAGMQAAVGEALGRLARMAAEGLYDVLILDEIVFCLSKGLAEFKDIRNLIAGRAGGVEIVLTGRGATDELIELADLVTEMKNIKHPFDKGRPARRGIEY